MAISKAWLLSAATLLLLHGKRTCVQASRITYGTKNGFDKGGVEPVCMLSRLWDVPETAVPEDDGNAEMLKPNFDSGGEVEISNPSALLGSVEDALFADDDDDASSGGETPEIGILADPSPINTVDLLEECFNGTNLQVRGLDLLEGSAAYREKWYTFGVSLQMNTGDAIAGNGPLHVQGIFVRFIMCNVLNMGFCNAVVETPSSINTTVLPISSNSTILLNGVVDSEQKMVFSSWAEPEISFVDGFTVEVEDFEAKFQIPRETPPGLYRFVFHAVLIADGEDTTTTIDDVKVDAAGSGDRNESGTGDVKVEPESSVDSSSVENNNAALTIRLDISAQSQEQIISVEDPPKTLEMSKTIKILIYVLIALYDVGASFVLCELIRFRKHNAVRLAQGSFLAVLTGASIVGCSFTFTYMPEQDWYCSARGFLVLLPFTMIGAILVARLWRVYVTLNGAMALGKSSKVGQSARMGSQTGIRRFDLLQKIVDFLTWIAQVPLLPYLVNLCTKKKPETRHHRRASSHLRKTASAAETAQLVIFLVLPQVILQGVGLIIYTPKLELSLNETEQVGRYFCDEKWSWVSITGFFLAAIIYAFSILLAWQGRHLPSAFNEKDAIFQSGCIAAVLIMINVVVVEMTDNETTSPDSSAFLRVMTFIGIATLVIVYLVWPKLRRAMKGENVVVGNLLRAYGNASGLSADSNIEIEDTHKTALHLSGAPIIVKKDSPLPRELESEILTLKSLLQTVSDKSAYGHALSESEWGRMRRHVAKLKTELDRVTLDFGESSEQQEQTPASEPSSVVVVDDVEIDPKALYDLDEEKSGEAKRGKDHSVSFATIDTYAPSDKPAEIEGVVDD